MGTNREAQLDSVREQYRWFARNEATGVSPLYEELALTVAGDDTLCAFVADLPKGKQQPNLVFACVRHLYGTPTDSNHFTELIRNFAEPIRQLILRRSTQTNEPGRCATLVPVLGQLSGPIALIEVGASAGLCLLPELYGYDYGSRRLEPADLDAPVFPCAVNEATPLPKQLPQVVWRRGLDLRPIDLAEQDEVAWLQTLVWPGQEERCQRLAAAIRIASRLEPLVVKGDLRALAERAPSNAALVIFHSAVLAYLSSASETAAFASLVKALNAVWISNESPSVFPAIAAKVPDRPPDNRFLLSVDGKPVAFTGMHGQSIHWIGSRR